MEYLKYFDWKKEYNLFYQNPYCTICQKLHNENEQKKMYPNISKWYYEDNEGKKQCTDGSQREYYKSFMTDKKGLEEKHFFSFFLHARIQKSRKAFFLRKPFLHLEITFFKK